MGKGSAGGRGGNLITLVLVVGALIGVTLLIPGGKESDFRPMSSPAKPLRIVVPSLKIRADVLPIEVDKRDNILDPPGDVTKVGWWRRSVRAGADHGQTVLTGHTVHTGGGVMDELGRLQPGNVVRLVTSKGTMVYETTKVVTYSKAQIAAKSAELFGQQRDSNRLVLVTCTGWVKGVYTKNTVVFAKPLGVRVKHAKKSA